MDIRLYENLAVNRQVHAETAEMLYGESLFAFVVRPDDIRYTYFRKHANWSYLHHSKPFAGFFSQRNFARIHNYSINAPVLDECTCTSGHNFGAGKLLAGYRL
jgi:hypothetical protein